MKFIHDRYFVRHVLLKTWQHLNFLLKSCMGAIYQEAVFQGGKASSYFLKVLEKGQRIYQYWTDVHFRDSFLLCFTVVRCQSLQAPDEGHVSPGSCAVSPEYGTTCHFSCKKGYRLHGEPMTSCLSDGQWSKDRNVSCKGQLMFLLLFFNNFR